MINDPKTQGEWKIELTMAIDFMFSKDSKSYKDSNENSSLHTKRDNIETIIGNETNKIIEEFFDSRLERCQEGLKESMKQGGFAFGSLDLLCIKYHQVSLNCAGSYIDSPK